MEYLVSDRRLTARLARDFNLLTARRIERLLPQVDEVRIDLTRAKIVDSEAIMLLYRMRMAGVRIRLMNPPAILREALAILGLDEVLPLDDLVEA